MNHTANRTSTATLVLAATLAFALVAASPAAAADAPTYSRDVAPIFFKNCVQCHRTGEIAPMSLMTYREARPWARSIARAVENRDMPPWSGDSDNHEWSNDISLTDGEIEKIVDWAKAGAPQGDPADLPEAPTFPTGWKLGEPDHVVTLDSIEVPAEGDDLFPQQVIEVDLGEPRWIRAIEFLPEDSRVTHHFLTTYATSMGEGGPAYTGVLGIWTAGMPPYVFPDGVGRRFGSKIRIIVDQHYHPIGEASRIGLHFGEGELQKEVITIPVTNTGLRIPPGAGHHAETAHRLFDKDTQILAFSPHMHVRGKAMTYVVTYPDGSTETLLSGTTRPRTRPTRTRRRKSSIAATRSARCSTASSKSCRKTACSSNSRTRSSRSAISWRCTRRGTPTCPGASWAFMFRAKAKAGSTWAASTPSSSTTSSGRATS